jgi:hypothetical protein
MASSASIRLFGIHPPLFRLFRLEKDEAKDRAHSSIPRLARPSDVVLSADPVTQGPRLLLLTSSFSCLPYPIKHGANIAADESWAKLTLNIREIQHQNAHKLSFEECYRLSYQLVVSKNGEMLYNGVKDLVIENLNRLAEEIVIPAFPPALEQDPMQQSREGERLLKAVHKVWSDHTDSMDKLSHILKYMVCVLYQCVCRVAFSGYALS